ncbi:MAG: hypothetical protein LBJ18_03210 [Rickettsiales bacterium]|jgi:hypothetical protein|nr:hypothetical protein [Rickettsiales bacterium]
MIKNNAKTLHNLYKGQFTYILSGQLDKDLLFIHNNPPLSLVQEWDKNGNKESPILTHTDNRSKQMINAAIDNHEIFSDDININYKTNTISAKYTKLESAIRAMEYFPSAQISVSVSLAESDAHISRKNNIKHDDGITAESAIKFTRGWLLADPMIEHENQTLAKKIRKLAPVLISWDGRQNVWEYMQTQKWDAAVINYDFKKIFQFDRNTNIINEVIEKEWKAAARATFRSLEKALIKERFVKPAPDSEADEICERIGALSSEIDLYLKSQTEHTI